MSSVKMANSPVVIKVNVKTAGAQLEKRPIEITENGEYTPPKGVTYDPIIVTAKAKDEPLTIAENNTEIVVPDGIRYTPITVAIPKNYQEKSVLPTKKEQVIVADEGYNALSQVVVEPIPDDYVLDSPELHPTLNAPTISLNANGGYLNVTDYRNGNFTEAYRLYLNGEEKATFTNKTILMTEYGITETDEITVDCVAELFNTSPMSNMTKYSDVANGTIGLIYSGNQWTGIGTATDTTITVASIVSGTVISSISQTALKQNADTLTINLPDSITSIWGFEQSGNKTIIFGAKVSNIQTYCFYGSSNMVLDFRKATKVPAAANIQAVGIANGIVIVPDNLYDEWIIATNWSAYASIIIRATDYEAQQGGSV